MEHIRLNIFTNCRKDSDINIIKGTYDSFVGTFGTLPLTIYVDPNPNTKHFPRYLRELQRFDAEVIQTKSMSDGYVISLKSKEDYLFQLEHDWNFQNINHSLEELISLMERDDLSYLRFGSRENLQTPHMENYQTFLREKESHGIHYCETDNISNNPHIINKKKHIKKIVGKIEVRTSSFGMEEFLSKRGIIGAIYGGLGHPPTIKHTTSITSKANIKNERI